MHETMYYVSKLHFKNIYVYKDIFNAVKSMLSCNSCVVFNKQVKHLRLWIFECRDPSRKAFMMGLAAAILLGLAHVIVNLIGGCNCLCSQGEFEKASPNKQVSMLCLILTW